MNLTTKKQKTILYTVIQVVGMLFLCLIGGCFDFLNLEFTLEKIKTAEYWQGVMQQMVLYSCAIGLGYIGKLEREELNNEEYSNGLSLYKDLLKSKKESFIRYIEEVFNPDTKRQYIKLRANKRLHRLDKYSKDEWKLYYRNAIKSGNVLEYQYPNSKIKKYCVKRFQLEELASDAYINENIDYISIKYPRINPNCFTENIRLGDNNASRYKVENTTGRDVPLAMGRKLLTTLLAAIIIGSIAYDPSLDELLQQAHGWIAILIKYTIRVVMTVWSFFQGNWAGKEMFYNNFILVVNNRIAILKTYINWRHENNEPETYIDKFMEAYYNQEKLKEELQETISKAEKLST